MSLLLQNGEVERFNELYYSYGVTASSYNKNYENRKMPEAKTQLMKKIIDWSGSRSLSTEVEEGRYQLLPDAIVRHSTSKLLNSWTANAHQKDQAAALISSVAGVAYANDAITRAQYDLVVSQLGEVSFLQYARVIAGVLLELEMVEKNKNKLLEEAAVKKIFSFSNASTPNREVEVALKTLTRFCSNLVEEFKGYDFFVSWRSADVVMMSYGLSSSCYSAGGMYMQAPFVLSTMNNLFVAYSNTKNANSSFPMRRSRFFGISNEATIFSGRLYSKTGIKFLVSLLQFAHNGFRKTNKKLWNGEEAKRELSDILTGGKHRISFCEMFPGSGFTYTDDANSRTADIFIPGSESLTEELFNNFSAAKLIEENPCLEDAYYHCPDCGVTFFRNSELNMENSLSCCAEREWCHCCEEYVAEVEYVEGHETVCSDCLSNYFFYCDGCNEYISDEETCYHTHNRVLCSDCHDDNYVICEECENSVDRTEVEVVDGHNYCEDCAYELEKGEQE